MGSNCNKAVGWLTDCYTPRQWASRLTAIPLGSGLAVCWLLTAPAPLHHLTTAAPCTPTLQTHNSHVLQDAVLARTASASVLMSVLLCCPILPLPPAAQVLRRRCQQ